MNKIADLKKVSNYARQIGKSPQWVYELAKRGEIKLLVIDGVKFVVDEKGI